MTMTPVPIEPSVGTSWLGHIRRSTFIGVGSIVGADQLSKAFVREFVSPHDSISLIPGFVNLTHVQNTGAAFGILNAANFPFKPVVMTGVALLALVTLGVYAVRSTSHSTAAQVGLALIVGGAFGNLIDRIAIGHVTDFVDVYWGMRHFWAFNIADSAITIGASCLLVDTLDTRHHDVPDAS